MSKAKLLVLAVLLCVGTSLYGQSLPGQAVATQYGQWRVNGYSPNNYAFPPNTCIIAAGKQTVQPIFATNAPVKIVDADPNMTETVTPAAVQYNQQTCAIAVSPAHQHNSFNLMSGSCGLQEAINAQAGQTSVIIITPDFNGMGCNSSTITAAQGSAAVSILDERTSVIVPYVWSGSAYAAQPFAGGGTNLAAPQYLVPLYTLPVTGSTLGPAPTPANTMFSDGVGNYTVPGNQSFTSINWATQTVNQFTPGSDPCAQINYLGTQLPSTGGTIDLTGFDAPSPIFTHPLPPCTTQVTAQSTPSKPVFIKLPVANIITMNTVSAAPCSWPLANNSDLEAIGRNNLHGNIIGGAGFVGSNKGQSGLAVRVAITAVTINADVATFTTAPNFFTVNDIATIGGLTTFGYLNGQTGPILASPAPTSTSFSMSADRPNASGSDTGVVELMPYGLLCNQTQTGGQQSFVIRNVAASYNTSATDPGPLFSVIGTFVNTVLAENQTTNCMNSCLLWQPGGYQFTPPSTLTPPAFRGSSDITFRDNNWADQGTTDHMGCNVNINAQNNFTAGSGISYGLFHGGAIENQAAHSPLFCINGNHLGAMSIFNVFNVDFEFSSSTAGTWWPNVDPFQFTDVNHLTIDGMSITGRIATGTGAPAHLVDISQSSATPGETSDIELKKFRFNRTWLGAPLSSPIHNTVNGSDPPAMPQSASWLGYDDFVFHGEGTGSTDNSTIYATTIDPPALTPGQCWFNTARDLSHFSCTWDGTSIFQLANSFDLANSGFTVSTTSDQLNGSGNFETGTGTTPTGWNTACSSTLTCVFTRDNTTAAPVAGSTYSEQINITANTSPLGFAPGANIQYTTAQTITVGEKLQIQVWAKSDGVTQATGTWSLAGTLGSPVYCSGKIPALTATWTPYFFSCTVQTASSSAFFRVGGTWPGTNTGAIWEDLFISSAVQTLAPGLPIVSVGSFSVGTAPSGVSASIGGGALGANACATGTATLTGVTSSNVILVTPVADPNASGTQNYTWYGYMSSANTVTVKVCALVAGTPAATAYNVRAL